MSQDNVLIGPGIFPYIHHVGSTFNLYSIINNGLILGGQDLSRRQTVFFLPIGPRDESHFFVIHNMCIEKKMEQFISGELRKIFRIHSHNLFICLTVDGKHVWQQEEEQKGDSSFVLMIQEQLFISELFKDIQDAILLILHCRTMW